MLMCGITGWRDSGTCDCRVKKAEVENLMVLFDSVDMSYRRNSSALLDGYVRVGRLMEF